MVPRVSWNSSFPASPATVASAVCREAVFSVFSFVFSIINNNKYGPNDLVVVLHVLVACQLAVSTLSAWARILASYRKL